MKNIKTLLFVSCLFFTAYTACLSPREKKQVEDQIAASRNFYRQINDLLQDDRYEQALVRARQFMKGIEKLRETWGAQSEIFAQYEHEMLAYIDQIQKLLNPAPTAPSTSATAPESTPQPTVPVPAPKTPSRDDEQTHTTSTEQEPASVQQSSLLDTASDTAARALNKFVSFFRSTPQTPVIHRPAKPVAATLSLDEQIRTFFSTDGSSTKIARIEHGQLVPDLNPTLCDQDDNIWDAPIVFGLVRPGAQLGVAYITPYTWAHSVILPGIARDWIEHGLDLNKSAVQAIRIYRQNSPRVLTLQQELPMLEQQQRKHFMPIIVETPGSQIAILAAAESIELNDPENLTPAERDALRQSVADQLEKSVEQLEQEDAYSKKEAEALQEETCARWIADFEHAGPTEIINESVQALWIALQAEAEEMIQALQAHPHRNLKRETQHHEEWLRAFQYTFKSALTTEQQNTMHAIEEAFTRANLTVAGVSDHDIDAALRESLTHR